MWDKLNDIQNRGPRAFWNLYSKLNELEKKQKVNPISSDEWIKHFTTLFRTPTNYDSNFEREINDFVESNSCKVFNELNHRINESEISLATNNLKRNKAVGIYCITGEIIKASAPFIISSLKSLFNRIFTSGHFPKIWRTNTLSPLHKKGSSMITDNYRGIAVGSCLSKLFLSILHNRLVTFAEKHNVIPSCQIGYKKGTRTSDHILALKIL